MIKVYCLDTNEILEFFAQTPREAMEKLLYTLKPDQFRPGGTHSGTRRRQDADRRPFRPNLELHNCCR